MSGHHTEVGEAFERGRAAGRADVLRYLRDTAAHWTRPDHRGGALSFLTRQIGVKAVNSVADIVELHFSPPIVTPKK